MADFLIFCNKIADFAKDFWQFFLLFCCEFGQYEIYVPDLLAEFIIGGTDAKAWEIFSPKLGDAGFETIIAASAALFAEAQLAKFEVKIIANDQKVARLKFIEVHDGACGTADFVVIGLSLNQ